VLLVSLQKQAHAYPLQNNMFEQPSEGRAIVICWNHQQEVHPNSSATSECLTSNR
jgi:hypothetical protein